MDINQLTDKETVIPSCDHATVEWTDKDEKALTVLQAKKALVQKIHREDLIGWLGTNCPLGTGPSMTDAELADLMLEHADALIEMLATHRKGE